MRVGNNIQPLCLRVSCLLWKEIISHIIHIDIPLNERITYKRKKLASVVVWAGVTSTGEKTRLTFIEEGVKINQDVYLNMLKNNWFLGSMQYLRSLVLLSNKMEPHPTLLILSKSGATRIWQISGHRSYGPLLHRI